MVSRHGLISDFGFALTFSSRNCNMFFRRVYEKDDAAAQTNITPVAVAMSQAIPSTSSNFIVRFGEPSVRTQKRKRGIGRPETGASGDPRATKRRQQANDDGNKVLAEDEHSDSDDEDFRGFIRITLVSKRRRTKWFTSHQTETFSAAAERLNANYTTTSAANNTIRRQVSYATGDQKIAETTADLKATVSGIASQAFRDNLADDMELNSDSDDDSNSGSEIFQHDTSPEDEVTMEPQLPIYRKGTLICIVPNHTQEALTVKLRSTSWFPRTRKKQRP